MTRRQDIIALLTGTPMTLDELAIEFETTTQQIAEDLRHIRRTLKHDTRTLYAEPVRCVQCGCELVLKRAKVPTRCPKCKSEQLEAPRFLVRE